MLFASLSLQVSPNNLQLCITIFERHKINQDYKSYLEQILAPKTIMYI